MLRVYDGAGWGEDRDGAGDAVVVEDVFRDEAAEGVKGGGEGDGQVGVDAAGGLEVGAGEVDDRGVVRDADRATDANRLVAEAVVVERVGILVGALGDLGDGAAEDALGVVLGEGGVVRGALVAVAADDVEQACGADAVGGDLGGEVAFALVRGADVGEDEGRGFRGQFCRA